MLTSDFSENTATHMVTEGERRLASACCQMTFDLFYSPQIPQMARSGHIA